MTTERTASPHTVLAMAIGGAALAGAAVGWTLMRVAYRLDRLATPDGTGDPIWALTWTDASFPFTIVAIVVLTFTALFGVLAAAVAVSHQRSVRDIARQRRILAHTRPVPLLQRSNLGSVAWPTNRGTPSR